MSASPEQHEISVVVAPDRTRATVVIPSEYDPSLVSLETLVAVARSKDVVVEDREKVALQDAAAEFLDSGKRIEKVFAEAVLPQRGEDTEVQWAEGFDPDAPVEQCEQGSVDHYNTNSLNEVHAGDVVATLVERTEGVEGRDVLGNAIPAPRGTDAPITFCSKSFEIKSDGSVVALREGVKKIERGECLIDDVLDIRGNVNFESGNIETQGSVRVSGDVKDRFVIKAEKDVFVGGLVEAATIVCGGSLKIPKGMTGRGSGSIDVGGDFEVGFLDEVDATVHGNVSIRREAMSMTFRVGGNLEAAAAALIGGDITVGGSLVVGQLGSPSEAPTTVRLGSLPMLELEISQAKEKQREADKALKLASNQEEQLKSMSAVMTPQMAEKLTELQFQSMAATQQLNEATERIAELETMLGENARVELVVRKAIYPRVTLMTESQTITVPKPIKGPVTFCWSEARRLLMQRVDGQWYDADASIRRAAA